MPEHVVQTDSETPVRRWLLVAALPVMLHLLTLAPDEPVYNGDANRHAMTSVFFHDVLVDLPLDHPRQYAEDYYQQYPALGLMIWPPLFHGVAGLLMTIFGTSALVPRLLVFACFLFAAWNLYKLSRRRMSAQQAEIVVVIFSLMPMIFEYSRFIMLEVPTLTLCLFSIERFDIWLSAQRTKNLYIAAIAAALAALTRFDAVVLLPTLLLLALLEGRWRRLLTWHVPFAAIIALCLLGPTYAVIWKELGDLHVRQAAESVSGNTPELFDFGAIPYYPMCIPFQAGWVVAGFGLIGLIGAFTRQRRSTSTIFAAMLIGTYVTFTPLAEHRSRHAIYWLPAVAYFASVGATVLATGLQRLSAWRLESTTSIAFAIVVCGTAISTFFLHPHRVTGYAAAATAALQNSENGDRILIDAWWDGNITYHLRHLDESRSRHIVRADHIMYDFINVPSVDFEQFVESDEDILRAIADSTATCIVFEDPQPFGHIPISERIHDIVISMPTQFPLRETIPVDLTFPGARPFALKVFSVNSEELQAVLEQADHGTELSSTTPQTILQIKHTDVQ